MEFRLSSEDQDLKSVVHDVVVAHVDPTQFDSGSFDAKLWAQLGELGLLGIAVPEQFGGAGYGFVQVGVVLEELGAALARVPFLGSSVMATELLLGLDDSEASRTYLPAMASGELIAAVALSGEAGSWSLDDVQTAAVADGDGWRLNGRTSFVVDGSSADVLFVLAHADTGPCVFAIDSSATGVNRDRLGAWDESRDLTRVVFDHALAVRLGDATVTREAVERMLDHTAIALAVDSVGGISRTLDMAVEYSKTREQFGRPIGSFQAIKHSCASVLVDLESARSASLYATWAASQLHPDVPRVASLAKAFCADAYVNAAAENIQIHGGIGFTWEHSAHRYLKRAKSNQTLLGSSSEHRQRLAAHLGMPGETGGSRLSAVAHA